MRAFSAVLFGFVCTALTPHRLNLTLFIGYVRKTESLFDSPVKERGTGSTQCKSLLLFYMFISYVKIPRQVELIQLKGD